MTRIPCLPAWILRIAVCALVILQPPTSVAAQAPGAQKPPAAQQVPTTWSEFKTGIELPQRPMAHPFQVVATPENDLVMAWIAGADGKGALYTARFHEEKWSPPERLFPLTRPCELALFLWKGKPHLLETGSGQRFFGIHEGGEWKRLPYPITSSARQPAVAVAKNNDVWIAYVGRVKRVSRRPRSGAVFDLAGKVFLRPLSAQGKSGKTQGLDTTSQSRAARPAVALDPEGGVHVVMERSYGQKARPNIGYVDAAEPRSAIRVSRQPGEGPELMALSKHELYAYWTDRTGVLESVFDGRQWNPPAMVASRASDPHLTPGPDRRAHLVVFSPQRTILYLCRGPRGWSLPMDFGLAAGSGRAVETPDGRIHLIWESQGAFVHRASRKEKS